MSEKARVGVAAVCAALLACPSVWAQGAPEKKAAAPAQGKSEAAAEGDVILTRDGKVFRGKLTDDVDDDYVFILTEDGKKQKVALGDIDYAGPANKAPKLPEQPAGTDEPTTESGSSDDVAELEAEALKGKFMVKAEAADRTTVFHLRPASSDAGDGQSTSSSGDDPPYRILCDTPPCQAAVEPGSYEFALTESTDEDGEPVRAPGVVDINGNTTVSGEFHSYWGLRTAGWITIFGGMGVAGIMMANSSNDCNDLDPDCEPLDPVWLGAGIGVLAVTFVTGLLMTGKDDEAEVRVAAGATRLPTARASTTTPKTGKLAPALRLSGRF